MDRGAERGPEASPAQFPHISALQSSPKSTVTQLAVYDYRDFYTKTTLNTATTLPPVIIICFEIW